MPRDEPGSGGVWRLLRERWMWWVIPILVMLALTGVLAVIGQGEELKPVRYDVPSAPP